MAFGLGLVAVGLHQVEGGDIAQTQQGLALPRSVPDALVAVAIEQFGIQLGQALVLVAAVGHQPGLLVVTTQQRALRRVLALELRGCRSQQFVLGRQRRFGAPLAFVQQLFELGHAGRQGQALGFGRLQLLIGGTLRRRGPAGQLFFTLQLLGHLGALAIELCLFGLGLLQLLLQALQLLLRAARGFLGAAVGLLRSGRRARERQTGESGQRPAPRPGKRWGFRGAAHARPQKRKDRSTCSTSTDKGPPLTASVLMASPLSQRRLAVLLRPRP